MTPPPTLPKPPIPLQIHRKAVLNRPQSREAFIFLKIREIPLLSVLWKMKTTPQQPTRRCLELPH